MVYKRMTRLVFSITFDTGIKLRFLSLDLDTHVKQIFRMSEYFYLHVRNPRRIVEKKVFSNDERTMWDTCETTRPSSEIAEQMELWS